MSSAATRRPRGRTIRRGRPAALALVVGFALLGTYVLGAAGCKGVPDGLALIVAPSGPGAVEQQEDESYFTTVRIGEPLDFVARTTANNPDDRITLTIDVTGGTVEAGEAGFVSEFPLTAASVASQALEVVGTAAAPGTIELTATARSAGTTAAWTLIIHINAPPALLPPSGPGVVDGSASAFATVLLLGAPLDFSAVAIDPDDEQQLTVTADVTGGTLTAEQAGFVTTFPAEVSDEAPLSPTLVFEGVAAEMGTIEITVTVSDGWESDSWSLTIRITTLPEIGVPTGPGVVTDGPVDYTATVAAFEPLDFTIEATHADATAQVTFEATVTGGMLTPAEAGFATVLPASDSGSLSLVLSFTGTALTTAGTVELTFTAGDSYGNVVHATVTVVIEVEAPQFTNAPLLGADPGAPWRYTPEVSGRPSPTVTASGYPSWMTWDGTTLSGTGGPADLPTGVITVTASNGVDPDAILTFTVSMNDWHLEATGEHLRSVWAESSSHVSVVGSRGLVTRYDGTSWKILESGTTIQFLGVWGAAPDLVIAVGSHGLMSHFSGYQRTNHLSIGLSPVVAVQGRSVDEVYAVTTNWDVLHFDGTGWSLMNSLASMINSLWLSTNSDYIIFAGNGAWTYDGGSWRRWWLHSGPHFRSVWGISESFIFAVGEVGLMHHYNGFHWTQITSVTGNRLRGIWGSSNTDFFAVGDNATIIHFDGNAWSPMTVGPSVGALYSVSGTSPTNVYAVGDGGANLRYDGTSWSTVWLPTARALITGVTGPSDDTYAVDDDGNVYNFDGTEWSAVHTASGGLNAAWHAATSNVVAVGSEGRIEHFNGTSWTTPSAGTTSDLHDVWGFGDASYAVGNTGTILTGNFTSWSSMSSPTTEHLFAIHGTAANNIFAVGDQGTILHYDGTEWTESTSGTTTRLNSVWAASADNVFAAGENGTILHFDGTTWTPMASGTPRHLYAIHGRAADDVYAVGDRGTILRYDGSTWHTLDARSQLPFHSIGVNADSATILLGSDNGFILRYGP